MTTQIAGWKTTEDWRQFRTLLSGSTDASIWKKAYDDYFCTRLDLRYFNPIKILQTNGTFEGEGFSILAIQCTLIEFLESTVQGTNYRFLKKGETLGPYEYTSSQDIFVAFLCQRHPFDKHFDEPLARKFYTGVRCGLLHEARTKDGWKVWAKSHDGTIVNGSKLIVYRDNFQLALHDFIGWYESALQTEIRLQEAFIRKFDNLCV